MGGFSHVRGDDYICEIHDPDVSMSCFRAPCQTSAPSILELGLQKLPENVFYSIKVSTTWLLGGNFDLFAFLASSLRTAVKWLGLELGLGIFVSKCLGLAKMSTCISRNVWCASYEMEEIIVWLRLGHDFTCGFRLWLRIHALGSWFPTRVGFF